MANGSGDAKVWNMANLIITALAGIIALLVSAGFYQLTNKIEQGDAAIYARLGEMRNDIKGQNECIMALQKEITRIDTLQKIRIERDNRIEDRRNGGR